MMKKKLLALFLCLSTLGIISIFSKTQTFAYTKPESNDTLSNVTKIDCYNDLTEACALGGTYMLTDSITLENSITIPPDISLTLIQEPGKKHCISSNDNLKALFYVKNNGTLTLGSSFSDPVILDGNNLTAYGSAISSMGTLTIKNADISSPNGTGILCDSIYFENGQIHNCKYEGLSIHSNGTILNGSFSNCMYGIFANPESTVVIQNGEYTYNQTAVYSNGNCTIYDGFFSKCEFTLQSSLCGSIYFTGGVISDAGCWALDVSNGGSIYFTGGEIKNSRSTTYPAPDKIIQGNLYLSGSPYMDKSSFIYCRTGSPIIQTGPLSAPSNHPDAKLQIAAYSLDTPVVIATSESVQMEEEKSWYIPYDSSYDFVVTDNALSPTGVVSPYDGQLPTIRPDTCSTESPQIPTLPPTTTCPPASTIQVPETNPPELDYSSFVHTTPTITNINCKGLSFHLTWNFDCILSPDNYAIYYSTDRKHYILKKTIVGSKTTATLSIPKAFKGKRIYFYIVATISEEDTIYKSQKSNIASKCLLSKVTGTSISYYIDTEKLKITWNRISNCTGYYIYIKAKSGGITSLKKCASVSSSRHSTFISSAKIKRLFSRNGKPVRIKGCYVKGYYKSGNRVAYSP